MTATKNTDTQQLTRKQKHIHTKNEHIVKRQLRQTTDTNTINK